MPQRPTPAEEQAQQAFPVQAHEPDRFIGHHLRQRVEDRAPYARAGPVEHRDELSGRALPYPPAVARTSEAQEHLGFLLVAEDRQRSLALPRSTVSTSTRPFSFLAINQYVEPGARPVPFSVNNLRPFSLLPFPLSLGPTTPSSSWARHRG